MPNLEIIAAQRKQEADVSVHYAYYRLENITDITNVLFINKVLS